MRTAVAVIAFAAAADAFAPMPAAVPRHGRGFLRMAADPPPSHLPSNKAKEGALSANKEQWGISAPIKAGPSDDEKTPWILSPPETNPQERGTLRKESETLVREREERVVAAAERVAAAAAAGTRKVTAEEIKALAGKFRDMDEEEALPKLRALGYEGELLEKLWEEISAPAWILSPPKTNPQERGTLRKESETLVREREERAAEALAKAAGGTRKVTIDEVKALAGKFRGMKREDAEPKLVALGYEGELLDAVWDQISGPAWILSPPQTQAVERGTLRGATPDARVDRAAEALERSRGGSRTITRDEVKALVKQFGGMERDMAEPKLVAMGYEGTLLDKVWQEIQNNGPLWLLSPPQTETVERGTLRKESETLVREREERAATAAASSRGGVRAITRDEVVALAKQFGKMKREDAEPKLVALGYEGELLDAVWQQVSNEGPLWPLSPPETSPPAERGTLRKASGTLTREREERAAAQSPIGRMDLAKARALEANRVQWGIEEPLKPIPQPPKIPFPLSPPETKPVERGTLRKK